MLYRNLSTIWMRLWRQCWSSGCCSDLWTGASAPSTALWLCWTLVRVSGMSESLTVEPPTFKLLLSCSRAFSHRRPSVHGTACCSAGRMAQAHLLDFAEYASGLGDTSLHVLHCVHSRVLVLFPSLLFCLLRPLSHERAWSCRGESSRRCLPRVGECLSSMAFFE